MRNTASALNCVATAPRGNHVPRPFRRLSLCAAAIGALRPLLRSPLRPRAPPEEAVIIPAPTTDRAARQRHPDRGHRRRLLLGRAGRVPAHRWRGQCGVRLRRRQQGDRRLQHGIDGNHGARGDPSRSNTTRRRSATARSCRSSSRCVHDPTQLNRQGPDSGTQYRSAIFTTDDEQRKVAEAYIAQLNAAQVYKKPIVTKVGPLEAFYPAGGLSPGLSDAAPEPALYCLQRHPEGRRTSRRSLRTTTSRSRRW